MSTLVTNLDAEETQRRIVMQVETAEVQLDVIEEGIDELCSLESYMQRTHPPDESASLLAVSAGCESAQI